MIKSVWKCMNIIAISPKSGMEQAEIIDTFWTYHHFTPLSIAIQAPVRRSAVVSGVAGIGSESFTSRSIDTELIPRGPEEEMSIRLVHRRSREGVSCEA